MKNKYRVVYQPKGAALEYSPLAINLYIGCNHGCKYCYAPSCMMKKREDYMIPRIRKDVLSKLEKDLKEMEELNDNRRILFCFITDPYQKDFEGVTSEALELCHKYKKPFQVLTKGGMEAVKDFKYYTKKDAFAVTLTFDEKQKSVKWEPNAATPNERIESLKVAHSLGIETWVSFEPVIEPYETYKLFEKTKGFANLYKIGKINHYNTGISVDWGKFTKRIVKMCEENGNKYYIKHSLKPYI